jgi:hypothetical protein
MGPIFIHADPRIPRSEVDFVAEKMVLSGKDWEGLNKFFIGDPETGWERVYALKKIGDGRYSLTFTIGSSRSELLAGPDELGAPRVFSLTRYRMQQVLGFRARVLDPDDLPSYRFPWVARRLLSGAHQMVVFDEVDENDHFRRYLQEVADRLGMRLCLVVDENRAYYFAPGKAPGRFTEPPPRGGIWLPPVDVGGQ